MLGPGGGGGGGGCCCFNESYNQFLIKVDFVKLLSRHTRQVSDTERTILPLCYPIDKNVTNEEIRNIPCLFIEMCRDNREFGRFVR